MYLYQKNKISRNLPGWEQHKKEQSILALSYVLSDSKVLLY